MLWVVSNVLWVVVRALLGGCWGVARCLLWHCCAVTYIFFIVFIIHHYAVVSMFWIVASVLLRCSGWLGHCYLVVRMFKVV